MGNKQQELDLRLRDILTECNVDLSEGHIYFQPPESLRMVYPALVYNVSRRDYEQADNQLYAQFLIWDLTWISKTPLDFVVDALLSQLECCVPTREYVSDGLYHTQLSLYF